MFSKVRNLCNREERRGVHPVVATVFLIAISVSAAAMVFFVMVPFLHGYPEPEVGVVNYAQDTDGDCLPDVFVVQVMNTGTGDVRIDSVTIKWVNGTADPPVTPLSTVDFSPKKVSAAERSQHVVIRVVDTYDSYTLGSSDTSILYRFVAIVAFDEGSVLTTQVFSWSPK